MTSHEILTTWRRLAGLPDTGALEAAVKKIGKRKLAEMLVWNDPQSEYLDRFGDLTKSEAIEDTVKVVTSIWNSYARFKTKPSWL